MALASGYSDFNAGIALRGRDDALAVARFTAALADPNLPANLHAVALYDRADAYARLGKTDLALADYSASLALQPSYDAYIDRAKLNFLAGTIEPALKDLSDAASLRPDLLEARVLRVALLVENDRFAEALADEATLIQMEPNEPGLYVLRSAAYRRTGDYDAARKDADMAIALKPSDPAGYFAKASAFEAQGRLDDALAAIGIALQKSRRNLFAQMQKGILLWEQKKFEDAEQAFIDAQGLAPDFGYAQLWRTIAHRAAHPEESDPPPAAGKLDMAVWPAPLAALYDGAATPAQVAAAAAAATPADRRLHLCEADFYVAQWHLMNGRPAAGRKGLDKAVHDCPYDAVERAAAIAQERP